MAGEDLMSAQLVEVLSDTSGMGKGRLGQGKFSQFATAALPGVSKAAGSQNGQQLGNAIGTGLGAGLGALGGAPQIGAPIGGALGSLLGGMADQKGPDPAEQRARQEALRRLQTGRG